MHKGFDSLTITDDFIFCHTMQDKTICDKYYKTAGKNVSLIKLIISFMLNSPDNRTNLLYEYGRRVIL